MCVQASLNVASTLDLATAELEAVQWAKQQMQAPGVVAVKEVKKKEEEAVVVVAEETPDGMVQLVHTSLPATFVLSHMLFETQ